MHAAVPAPSIGAIVAGIVVCGILVLVLVCPIVLVALIVRRKRQNLSTATSENQEALAGPVYDELLKHTLNWSQIALMDR